MHVNVFIEPVNIGESMVQDVVLNFPNGSISAYQIENTAYPCIHPLLLLYASWLASCMTLSPIPANPNPMTNSINQNIQPLPASPHVIMPQGTK